jgi:hypothetical protein
MRRQAPQAKETPKCLGTDLSRASEAHLGLDLTTIPGLNVLAVLSLVSEIGTNMSKWRHENAFASVKVFWLRSQPSSPFPQTRKTGDFQPHLWLQTRLEG